jgi:hypothetical protein
MKLTRRRAEPGQVLERIRPILTCRVCKLSTGTRWARFCKACRPRFRHRARLLRACCAVCGSVFFTQKRTVFTCLHHRRVRVDAPSLTVAPVAAGKRRETAEAIEAMFARLAAAKRRGRYQGGGSHELVGRL